MTTTTNSTIVSIHHISSVVKRPLQGLSRWVKMLASVGIAVVASAFANGQAQAQTTVPFTTAGNTTWTCPVGVTSVQVQVWGGGGGSGGAGAHYASTGGGAGGSFVQCSVNVTPGTTYQLTVGSGGTAGAGGAAGTGATGGTGGSSYFGNTSAGSPSGALVLAVGGPGSVGNNATGTSTTNRTATNGATATNSGNITSGLGTTANFAGTNGANAVTNSNNSGAGGAGAGPTGSSNGGAGGAALTSAGNGNPGTAPGGGGSGGDQSSSASNGTGGVGGAGEVVLSYTASTPTISATGTPGSISAGLGTASVPTNFSASGANLTTNLTVTAPSGFEVSTSSGSGYSSSISLTPTSGTVSATTIYVRLAATTAIGTYSGNVTLSSTGATSQTVVIPTSTVVSPFTQGNLTVEQLATNGNSSTFSFIELSPSAASQSAPANVFYIPSTGSSALRQSIAGTTGRLSTSNDGTLLAFTGFEDPTGVTDETTITSRAAVSLSQNYQLTLQASYTGVSANQTRGATYNNGIWYMADKGGLYLNGATTPVNSTNIRPVKSFGGTVYALTQSSATTPKVILQVSSDGTTETALPGLPADNLATEFYMISSGVNGSAYDILYVLDGANITKYSLVGTTWTANGSATSIGVTGDGFCAASNGTGAYLYTTTGATNTVVRITDTAGYNAAPSINTANNVTLYTGTGAFLKGVSFAPLSTAMPDLTIGVSAPSSVGSGSNFNYTITAANSGAATATGVNLQLTLPLGVTFVSAADGGSVGAGGFTVPTSTTTNTYGQQVVTFTGGMLNSGATDSLLTVTATASSTATYTVDAGSTITPGDGSAAINTSATTTTPLAESNTANNYPNIAASTTIVSASIGASGSLSALSTTYGTASSPTTFSASGSNLTGNITVTAPTGFEVSTSSGSSYGGSLSLTPTGGTVASTTIYVRMAATTPAGTYSGNVTLTASGAPTQTESIPSSTVSPLALTVSGAAVTPKPWDGTTAATITGTLVGVVSGDTVNLVGTGTFASSSDGSGISVSSTSTLSGASASNYTLTQPTGLTGTIQPSANLGALTTNVSGLTQPFSPGTTSYSSYVSSGTSTITLTPTADTGATVTVNGGSASNPVSLSTGSNTITVVVTKAGGGSTQTYTVTVYRAGPFTQGDLVVTVYGNTTPTSVHSDGQTTLITLEEFPPTITTNSTPAMAFVLPSSASGADVGIAGEYGSSSEGTIQLTGDGEYLTLGGYSAVPALAYNNYATGPSAATAQSPCATVPRVAALIDSNGNVDTSSVFNDIYNTNNPRSIYSLDDTNIYLSGQGAGATDEGGLYYSQIGTNTTSGGTAPTGIFNVVSTRIVQVYGGNLYYSADQNSASKGTQTGIFKYTGLPTTSQSTNTGTRLTPANSGSINYSPSAFYFASPTVMYVADTGDPKAGGTGDGGIQKWVYNGSSWVLQYTMTNPNFVSPSLATTATHGETGFEFLAGKVVSGVAYLYATTYTAGDGDANGLYAITDTVSATTLAGQTFTEIAAAPGIQVSGTNPDYIFKGVSFAPSIPVNPSSASSISSMGASLNGSVNPNGTDTIAYFQYGTSTAYGTSTTTQDLGSGTSPVSLSPATLTGLAAGTTYDYRLVTVAGGITTVYANQTFTTSANGGTVATATDTPTMPLWALVMLGGLLYFAGARLIGDKAKSSGA